MTGRYQGEERRQHADSWHLDKKFSIGIIIAILTQCGSFIWYAAQMDAKIMQTSIQVEQLAKWRLQSDDQLSKINSLQAAEGQKLDDLAQTVHHMDDLLEQHFYRK